MLIPRAVGLGRLLCKSPHRHCHCFAICSSTPALPLCPPSATAGAESLLGATFFQAEPYPGRAASLLPSVWAAWQPRFSASTDPFPAGATARMVQNRIPGRGRAGTCGSAARPEPGRARLTCSPCTQLSTGHSTQGRDGMHVVAQLGGGIGVSAVSNLGEAAV